MDGYVDVLYPISSATRGSADLGLASGKSPQSLSIQDRARQPDGAVAGSSISIS